MLRKLIFAQNKHWSFAGVSVPLPRHRNDGTRLEEIAQRGREVEKGCSHHYPRHGPCKATPFPHPLGKPRPCPWPAPREARAGPGALPAPEEKMVTGCLRPFWGALLSRMLCSGHGTRNAALEYCEAELVIWTHTYSFCYTHQVYEAWRRG